MTKEHKSSQIRTSFDRIAQEVVRFSGEFGLPEVLSVEKVTGGMTHHVYALDTEGEKFFLKIRGDRFSMIPEIEIEAGDIFYEHKALKLLGEILPENIVRSVFFDEKRNFMILENAIFDGDTLENEFLNNNVGNKTITKMGQLLRAIHEKTACINSFIHGANDDFYNLKLLHRFGYRNNPTLNSVIGYLKTMDRQIILGDFSPKNIGVNGNEKHLILFDLEDVHRGNPVVDVAFGVGHIILHSFNNVDNAITLTEHFLNSYGGKCERFVLKALTIGVFMYRLDSIIPYSIKAGGRVNEMLNNGEMLLSDFELSKVSWYHLVKMLLEGKI